MTEREYLLLSDAMRTVGLNEETIHYNAERMTGEEFDRLNGFVNWMIENGMTFGSGNYKRVWANYESGRDGCPACDADNYELHCSGCGYHPDLY